MQKAEVISAFFVEIIDAGVYDLMDIKFKWYLTLFLLASNTVCIAEATEKDGREFVQLPAMMQQHMMGNMRDHLASINEILSNLGKEQLEIAATIAETRLGMSSLSTHGASHMATFMPEGMRKVGTDMHRAASRFALIAQEGELLPAYRALTSVTSTCVACHSAYRIR